MDESAPMRALTIGVSVFMAIATITAVMIYYNTAKNTAGVIGSRAVDIEGNYRQDIEDMLLYKNNITGTDVINIINYFRGNNEFEINLSNVRFIEDSQSAGLNCTKVNEKKICTTQEIKNINNINDDSIFQKTLKRILPNQDFSLSVTEPNENDIRTVTIGGK